MHILGGGLEPEEGYNHIPPLYEQYDTLHSTHNILSQQLT